jgi:N6-L-threonylcarbamoyladenine synthase
MRLFLLILPEFYAKLNNLSHKAIILGIESSCDDTSVAITENRRLLSNVIASQDVHKKFGGVVPELASRAHQMNIIPVLSEVLKQANIKISDINAIAFTNGPGLLGSLMVGASFAKGLSVALGVSLIEVNHLHGHVLSHFIIEDESKTEFPDFPHLCLLISGGHTQIVRVDSPYDMNILGSTIDDAAGEAFDKAAKLFGFGYPGGPIIDRYAQQGNAWRFHFPKPTVADLNFSFSGLKTSLLYFLKDKLKKDDQFISQNLNDLCASYQRVIVEILIEKTLKAVELTNIRCITLSGGVSANSEIRKQFTQLKEKGIRVVIPPIKYTTDNAAMIAIAGYYKI